MALNSLQLLAQCALALLLGAGAGAIASAAQQAPAQPAQATPVQREAVVAKPKLDRSGKARKGKASSYSRKFYRKKTASGKPLNPNKAVAASKTLPLGTVAKVTNLKTGESDVVTIEDRGPYVKGRTIDVTPKTADKIGLKKDGVAPVEVKPLLVPPPEAPKKADSSPPATK